jgi:hypothetical protein
MSLTTRFGLVAGTTALAIAGTAFGGVESDNDALSQIAELKQELAELKQQDSQDWLTEQRSSEIRGIVQDVLADADTRTSFQNSGAMAGWNKGFFLASPDGNFRLNVSGFAQVRWTMNNRGGDDPDGNSNGNTYGFENADTYLDFSGHVVDPSWQYHVRGNFSGGATGDGSMGLTFASLTKDLGDGFGVTVGQFRSPFLRETLVDDNHQLGVNRSVQEAQFSLGFDQGIQLNYASDAFRMNAFLGDGNYINADNSPWNTTQSDYSLAARGEYKISGDWSTFDNFTSFKGEEGGMMVGVAGFYTKVNGNGAVTLNGDLGPGQGVFADGDKIYGFTADFSWEMGGANLFASYVWATSDVDDSPSPWGVNVQGGYFVTDEVELYARFDYVNFDIEDNNDKFNGLFFGANYFFASNVKATVEWGLNLHEVVGNDYADQGFLADSADEDGQWALRAQLQMSF